MDSTVIVAIITGGTTIINVAVSAIISAISQRKARKAAVDNNQNEKIALIEDGLQALLRAEIIRSHDKYTEREYCPIYAKEALTRCYNVYHALGGNDVATELYRQVMSLPEKENDNEN